MSRHFASAQRIALTLSGALVFAALFVGAAVPVMPIA